MNNVDSQFHCIMELNRKLNCWTSISPNDGNSHHEMMSFYDKNHFMIGYDFFDPTWSNEIQSEEIFKKLILLYKFDNNDENTNIVRGPKVIYFKDRQFVELPPGGVFVYDKTKVKVDYEESE